MMTELVRAVRLVIAGSSLFSQRVADRLNMHSTDLQFMNILDLLGPVTPAVLARLSGLSSGGVTVVLDRLERAGCVVRKPNPKDRRSVVVQPVQSKLKSIAANYRGVEAQFHSKLADFTEADLETVLRFFERATERS